MDYGKADGGWLKAIKSDGTEVAVAADGSVTLADSTTYYIPLGSSQAVLPAETALAALHLKWAAAVAATITIEDTNFPAKVGGMAGGAGYDVTDYDSTAGNWIQENPTTAYVAVTGSGNSATGLTLTAGGSAAGGALMHLGNLGSRRVRAKLVVTTGGKVWANAHGKSAA